MVNASGTDPAYYEAVLLAAQSGRRVVLVETASVHATAWVALFEERCPLLLIEPPVGGVHPALTPPGELH
jgi:hypothetical protein